MTTNSKNIVLPLLLKKSNKQNDVRLIKSKRTKFSLIKTKSISSLDTNNICNNKTFYKKVEKAKETCKRVQHILNSPAEQLLTNNEDKKEENEIKKTQIGAEEIQNKRYFNSQVQEDYRKQIQRNLEWGSSSSLLGSTRQKSITKKFYIRQQTNQLLSLIEPNFFTNLDNVKSIAKISIVSNRAKLFLKSKQELRQNDGIIFYDHNKHSRAVQIQQKLKQWKKKQIQIMRM